MVTATLSIIAVNGEPTPDLIVNTTSTLSLEHITYSPLVKACITENKPSILSGFWAAPIAFEFVTFCMTLYKGIEQAKTVKSIAKSPILYTLYR